MDCKAFSAFVGIDVSNVCAISNPNSIIFEHVFEMSMQGFSPFVDNLSSFSKNSIILAMESTGCYHLNLPSFLSLNNFSCIVFNPLTVKDSPSISLRKTKTDKIDARSIARTLFYLQQELPSSPFLNTELRDVVRERESIISRISKIKNNIEKLLNLLFPELERFTNIYNDSILNLLSSFPSANAIQNAPIDSLRAFFSKSVGRKPIFSPESLKELAINSIAQYWPMKEKILIQNIKELIFLQQQLKEYDEMFNQYCQCSSFNVDIELLTSIKGIGQNRAMPT